MGGQSQEMMGVRGVIVVFSEAVSVFVVSCGVLSYLNGESGTTL